MPGFDGTGPMGMGPMTGRGMGYCAIPLPSQGAVRVPYGYAGISGAVAPTAYPYIPYLGWTAPYVPFWRPCFGFGFGRGGGRCFGRGWFGFGRGRGRWFLGW